jgi:hypothetical protein
MSLKAKIKDKLSRVFGRQKITTVSSATSMSNQSENQQRSQHGSQPSTHTLTPADTSLPSYSSVPERLWNRAYDALRSRETPLVDTYEKILSVKLQENGTTLVDIKLTQNKISNDRKTRRSQMQQLLQAGLDRRQKQVSIQESISEGLRVFESLRGMIDQAVKASPDAAVAWVGVCLGIEVSDQSPQNARLERY